MKPSVSSEKKLQLIRRIRQEHQMNQNTIRGREAFLYGKNNLYESFSDAESGEMPESELPISTFRLRMAAALLLLLLTGGSAVLVKRIFEELLILALPHPAGHVHHGGRLVPN